MNFSLKRLGLGLLKGAKKLDQFVAKINPFQFISMESRYKRNSFYRFGIDRWEGLFDDPDGASQGFAE